MHVSLNVKNFFQHYILDPWNRKLSLQDQKIAAIASIALGCLTFGFLHLGISLTRGRGTVSAIPHNAKKVGTAGKQALEKSGQSSPAVAPTKGQGFHALEKAVAVSSKLFDDSLEPVNFYREDEENGIFSSFWQGNSLVVGGYEVPTAQNVFQGLKGLCIGSEDLSHLCYAAPNAWKAKAEAGKYTQQVIQNGWAKKVESLQIPASYLSGIAAHFAKIKRDHGGIADYTGKFSADPHIVSFTKQDAAMLYALRRKGEANPQFCEALIATKLRPLQEDTQLAYTTDYVWCNGQKRCGQNRMGLALMLYRAELKGDIAEPLSDEELVNAINPHGFPSESPGLCDPYLPPVLFYMETADYGIFSNYWKGNPLIFKGMQAATSEHLFQALKGFCGKANASLIKQCMGLPQTSQTGAHAGKHFNQLAFANGWAQKVDFGALKNKAAATAVYGSLAEEHFDKIEQDHGWIADYQGNAANSPHIKTFTKQDAAMLLTLRVKAISNPDFANTLLYTSHQPLIENTQSAQRVDYVWGNGPNGHGQNRLGLALMLLRAELQGKISMPLTEEDLFELITK